MGVQRHALHSPSSFFQHVFDFPFSFFPCWKKLRAHPASELFLKEGDLLRLLGESQTVRRPFSSSLFRLVGEDGGRPRHLTSTLFLGSEVLQFQGVAYSWNTQPFVGRNCFATAAKQSARVGFSPVSKGGKVAAQDSHR